jgi:hypothetical protein
MHAARRSIVVLCCDSVWGGRSVGSILAAVSHGRVPVTITMGMRVALPFTASSTPYVPMRYD